METNDFKIYLNQNLWVLVLSLTILGIAEYFKLDVLFWFGFILSLITGISVIITMIPYTIEYWTKKMKKMN